LAGEVTDDMLEAFAVVAPPSGLRAALDARATGLLDRVAPYPPFGSPAWRELSP
jgi:hypothetical protein